ncbi:MAG TPA: AraC family transcriptional regulator, partial [Arenicellales bacterium]|nr:AraC family transcriptional regulator [Arenicellales bacterium]
MPPSPAIETPHTDTFTNPRLVELAARLTGEPGHHDTAIPGLSLYRADEALTCHWGVCEPSLCFFIQGRKRISFGDQSIEFTALTYMVNNIHLPVQAGTLEASPEQPYLAAKIMIDPKEVAELILQFGDRLPAPERDSECPVGSCGMCRASMGEDTQRALERLLELLDKPEDIPVLAPMARREILYRAM